MGDEKLVYAIIAVSLTTPALGAAVLDYKRIDKKIEMILAGKQLSDPNSPGKDLKPMAPLKLKITPPFPVGWPSESGIYVYYGYHGQSALFDGIADGE